MTQTTVHKFLVALAGAVVAFAGVVGTSIDPATVDAVVGAITAILVYLIPNQPA